jgi:hypothetical protein
LIAACRRRCRRLIAVELATFKLNHGSSGNLSTPCDLVLGLM